MPVNVVVVDDHRVVRAGLVALLSRHREITIVGEAGNGAEAVRLARALKPDVVLMDIRMPEMNGVEATRQIRAESPTVEVLILTTYDDDELIWSGLEAGAKGYLLKDAPAEELISAIFQVAAGHSILPPNIAAKLVTRIRHGGGSPERPSANLTERELDILRLIAQGTPNKEIAATLHISENTVKTHISNVLHKMDAKDRTEAVAKALTQGLITL